MTERLGADEPLPWEELARFWRGLAETAQHPAQATPVRRTRNGASAPFVIPDEAHESHERRQQP